jgi:3-hydroxymyristoyl/3-hydroxydecanoyl-(acyl carrier protein) dehydratase
VASHFAERTLPADEPSAEGHFPGNPIIPGAILLREIVSVLPTDKGAICCEISSAKFLRPVRPGDRLAIAWQDKADGEIGFVCSTGNPERPVLVGTLRLRARG